MACPSTSLKCERRRLPRQCHVRLRLTAFNAPIVEAECAGPECRDLEEPARDHHVLEEVDHLVLVREVVVERNRCREREDGQGYGDEAHTIACDQKQATAELGCDSDSEGKRRKR